MWFKCLGCGAITLDGHLDIVNNPLGGNLVERIAVCPECGYDELDELWELPDEDEDESEEDSEE